MGTRYPLSDPRFVEQSPHLLEKSSNDFMEVGISVPALKWIADSIHHRTNMPAHWDISRDFDIDTPGAHILVDPFVNSGMPVIEGTHVSTRDVARALAPGTLSDKDVAHRFIITPEQARTAHLLEHILDMITPNPLFQTGGWHPFMRTGGAMAGLEP